MNLGTKSVSGYNNHGMDAAKNIKQESEQEPVQVTVRKEPEKELIKWSAPARPFKRKNRQFYVTLFAMVGLAALVLFLAEGIMPVVLLASLLFLYYIMNTVEPEIIEYKITTRGIYMAKKISEWNGLTRFWFSNRSEKDLLIIETLYFPGRAEYVIPDDRKDEIKKYLSSFLIEEEAPPTFLDKATSWFAAKLPGNK